MEQGKKKPPKPIDNIKSAVVLPSSLNGYGLFIGQAKKDEVLCVLDGQLIDYTEFDRLTKLRRDLPYIEWNAVSKEKILVRMFRTKYSYINHSRAPNCYVEIGEDSFVYLKAKFDLVNVELLLDYREEPLADAYIATHGRTYL
ncbi:MAG: hypothetical protein ACXWTX_01840 [Gallionella sp.]